MNNPLLNQWNTPFDAPPLHLIETIHFRPAVEKTIKSASEEFNSISRLLNRSKGLYS